MEKGQNTGNNLVTIGTQAYVGIMEHVGYASKKLLIKPRFIRASSRWSVLLWKDYGWFLIELSIFDFSSNFTGPDLQ